MRHGTGRESLADFEVTVRRGSPDPAVSGTAGLPLPAGVAPGDLRSAGWQGRETLPQLGPGSRPFREVIPGPFLNCSIDAIGTRPVRVAAPASRRRRV